MPGQVPAPLPAPTPSEQTPPLGGDAVTLLAPVRRARPLSARCAPWTARPARGARRAPPGVPRAACAADPPRGISRPLCDPRVESPGASGIPRGRQGPSSSGLAPGREAAAAGWGPGLGAGAGQAAWPSKPGGRAGGRREDTAPAARPRRGATGGGKAWLPLRRFRCASETWRKEREQPSQSEDGLGSGGGQGARESPFHLTTSCTN